MTRGTSKLHMFASEDELIAGMIEGNDTPFQAAISLYQVSMIYLAASLVGKKSLMTLFRKLGFPP